jgi:hypothetical protein
MRATHVHDSRFHREAERFEHSMRNVFFSAGSLLLTVITILLLYFGVFLSRSN